MDPIKKSFFARRRISTAGAAFENDALQEIVRLMRGYPYFIQEWGYQAWNHADQSPITLRHVHNATAKVVSRLDANFFRVRFDRLTPGEKNYLRAMAHLGPGFHRSGDVAITLGVKINSLGPVRAKLINKGMISVRPMVTWHLPFHCLVSLCDERYRNFRRKVSENGASFCWMQRPISPS